MREREPSLDPYAAKLERFELFSTNQAYYLLGCDKANTSYRVLKMDRTLIERPKEASGGGGYGGGPRAAVPASSSASASAHHSSSGTGGGAGAAGAGGNLASSTAPDLHLSSSSDSQTAQADSSHTAKPTLRPLSDFLTEDPVAYSQDEIKELLDQIHAGNLLSQQQAQSQPYQHNQSEMGGAPNQSAPKPGGGAGGGGGLKPLVKAYGVVGFVRFLDCYYLTLITKRAKVGSIGGNGIYTIKVRRI